MLFRSYSGGSKKIVKNIGLFFLEKFIDTGLWRPIYRLSLSRNHFALITENEKTKTAYEKYQGEIFFGKTFCVPLPPPQLNGFFSREEARRYLELPEKGFIFLSFGSDHAGKDLSLFLERSRRCLMYL